MTRTTLSLILLLMTGTILSFDPDERFTIRSPLKEQKLRKSWGLYPTSFQMDKKKGFKLTDSKKYNLSGAGYLNPIELSTQWEIDLDVVFGKSRPQNIAEKKGEKIKTKADTVAFHFSSHMIPAEAIGPEKDAIPVQGGVFLLLKGKKTTHIVFKYFSKYSGLTQRYMDIVYENAQAHTANLKHFSCSLRSRKLKNIVLSLRADLKEKQMNVFYKSSSNKKFKKCFTMNHIDRYFDLHYQFLTIFAMSPPSINSDIWLREAYLDVQKLSMENKALANQTYDQELFTDIQSRVLSLGETKNLPKKRVRSILKLEKMILKRAQLVEKYAIDFHQGLHGLQEFFIQGTNQNEGKKVTDIAALNKIQEKIKKLEKRQSTIYEKFLEMHKSVGGQKELKAMKTRFGMMEKQLDSISDNLGTEGLEDLIQKSQKMLSLFSKIKQQEEVLDKLKDLQTLGKLEEHHSLVYYIIMFAGVGIIAVLVILIIGKIRKSQKSHFL